LLSLVVLAVVGCGNDDESRREPLSKSEYQAALFEILGDSSAPTGHYFELVSRPRSNGEECAELMSTFHEELSDLVSDVAAIEPPPDVAAIQRDFLAAARRSVERVGEIDAAVAAGEVSCGRPLNDQLYGMASTEEAERAMGRLEQRGYALGGE